MWCSLFQHTGSKDKESKSAIEENAFEALERDFQEVTWNMHFLFCNIMNKFVSCQVLRLFKSY